MWAHIFQCKKCEREIKMVTNEMANPMRDRVGLHSSLYDEGASAYYHGATISLLRPQDKSCIGTLSYLHERVAQEIVREVYDPNAKVTEGTLGKVTDTLWQALPDELRKKLVNVLSANAPAQGGQGIKSLAGSPKYQGVTYNYELKFLGAFGNHRCYGNKVGAKVEFTVYDPNGTLH
jgi:hypothetical protein